MEIKPDRYLNQLISYMWDGQVKVITGIRRCGKSYLLRTLFRNHLLAQGTKFFRHTPLTTAYPGGITKQIE